MEARKLINVFALARSLDAEKALRVVTLATQAIEDDHESSRSISREKRKSLVRLDHGNVILPAGAIRRSKARGCSVFLSRYKDTDLKPRALSQGVFQF